MEAASIGSWRASLAIVTELLSGGSHSGTPTGHLFSWAELWRPFTNTSTIRTIQTYTLSFNLRDGCSFLHLYLGCIMSTSFLLDEYFSYFTWFPDSIANITDENCYSDLFISIGGTFSVNSWTPKHTTIQRIALRNA